MWSSSGFSGSGRQGGAWGAFSAVRREACFACSCFELVPLLLFPLGALRASALSSPPGGGMKARAIPGGSQSAGCSLMLFTEHGFSAPRGRSTSQTFRGNTRGPGTHRPRAGFAGGVHQKYSRTGGSGSGRPPCVASLRFCYSRVRARRPRRAPALGPSENGPQGLEDEAEFTSSSDGVRALSVTRKRNLAMRND
jgi:hypothetical protein